MMKTNAELIEQARELDSDIPVTIGVDGISSECSLSIGTFINAKNIENYRKLITALVDALEEAQKEIERLSHENFLCDERHKIDAEQREIFAARAEKAEAERADRLVRYEGTDIEHTRFGGNHHHFYGPDGTKCKNRSDAVAAWIAWLRQPAERSTQDGNDSGN